MSDEQERQAESAADKARKAADLHRRLTTGLVVLASFGCLVTVIALLLGWFDSISAAATPIIVLAVIAVAAARRRDSLG